MTPMMQVTLVVSNGGFPLLFGLISTDKNIPKMVSCKHRLSIGVLHLFICGFQLKINYPLGNHIFLLSVRNIQQWSSLYTSAHYLDYDMNNIPSEQLTHSYDLNTGYVQCLLPTCLRRFQITLNFNYDFRESSRIYFAKKDRPVKVASKDFDLEI